MAKTSGTVTRDRRKYWPIGSLKGVFERRTLTGSGRFTFLSGGFAQILSQIVSIRVKKLSNTNSISSKDIQREKTSLPDDARRPKTPLRKLPNKLTSASPVTIPETTAGLISAPVPFSCQSGECAAIVKTDAKNARGKITCFLFFPLDIVPATYLLSESLVQAIIVIRSVYIS